ncbi:MAG: hypothetical protein M3393_09660 [Actinomycetota bacterium]|nr:hypothetical protein [Actinomycetota bacterium]
MTAARRVYVHIGLPKTGTSYLQSIFWQSQSALEAQDLQLVPSVRSMGYHLMLAVREELVPDLDGPKASKILHRFREEAAALTSSRALISQELLGAASPHQAQALLGVLPHHEAHVVLTVRDLARHIPSAWQQQIKARAVMSYEDFRDEITASSTEAPWDPGYDLTGVLARWGACVPPERIHVVTVPKPNVPASVLLERFCSVVGVDPERLNQEVGRSNTSLGLTQAELLRRVNLTLGDRLPHPRSGYGEHGKRFLGQTILRPQGGEPAKLPERLSSWCERASLEIVERLASGGYDIVGDLDELLPDPSAFTGDDMVVSDAEVADAAAAALADILVARAGEQEEVATLRRQVRALRKKVRAVSARAQPAPSGRWGRVRTRLGRLTR